METVESMRSALEEPWDLVLSDYKLPQFNGLDALGLVQEMELDLPFIEDNSDDVDLTLRDVLQTRRQSLVWQHRRIAVRVGAAGI